MRHQDIQVGDTLKLKRDNPYGFGPALKTVTEVRYRSGYTVPFIICGTEAFKPRDFAGHVLTDPNVEHEVTADFRPRERITLTGRIHREERTT